jgi:hypothetical protein
MLLMRMLLYTSLVEKRCGECGKVREGNKRLKFNVAMKFRHGLKEANFRFCLEPFTLDSSLARDRRKKRGQSFPSAERIFAFAGLRVLLSRFAHPSDVQSQKRYSYCSTALFIPSCRTRSQCREEGGRLLSSRAQTVRHESLRKQDRLRASSVCYFYPSFIGLLDIIQHLHSIRYRAIVRASATISRMT